MTAMLVIPTPGGIFSDDRFPDDEDFLLWSQ
jgi:hypothetical protein